MSVVARENRQKLQPGYRSTRVSFRIGPWQLPLICAEVLPIRDQTALRAIEAGSRLTTNIESVRSIHDPYRSRRPRRGPVGHLAWNITADPGGTPGDRGLDPDRTLASRWVERPVCRSTLTTPYPSPGPRGHGRESALAGTIAPGRTSSSRTGDPPFRGESHQRRRSQRRARQLTSQATRALRGTWCSGPLSVPSRPPCIVARSGGISPST